MVIQKQQHLKGPGEVTLEKKNFCQQLIDYFFNEIKAGRLKPGDKLKNERELSEELGISRPPIREALKALSTIGILVTRHGGGTYVNTYDADYLNGVLKFATVFSDELLLDYIQLRMALESEAAKLAAKNATEQDLEEMRNIMAEREGLTEEFQGRFKEVTKELHKLDYRFHIAITKASRNVVFTEFIKSISKALNRHQIISSTVEANPQVFNDYHRKIYEAIEMKRPELASMIMYDHLSTVEKAVLKSKKKDNESNLTD